MVMLMTAGSYSSFIEFMTVLILFVFVLVITYVVTRWVSGFQKTQMTGRNMEILETMRLSNSKYLQIIRTGDKYLVIAVCKDTVTMLTELSQDGLSMDEGEGKSLSFKEVLEKMKHKDTEEKKTDEEKCSL